MSRNLNIWGVLDKSGTDRAKCSRKVASGRIWSLNVLVLHATLLVPVLMYGSETMLWKEEEVLDEKIDEGVLREFGHVEKMESDNIAKSVCRGLC